MIILRVLPHKFYAIRIQVITEYGAPLLRRRYDERAYARKDIRHYIRGTKLLNEAIVFGVQARVPVDLGEIKSELTVGFTLNDK
jgi:hypothetical protein